MSAKRTSLRIETLKAEHVPAILEIEKLANSAPWSERSFRGEIDNPQSVFIVAIDSSSESQSHRTPQGERSRIVGYAGLWVVVDEGHITTVAVAPEHRRQGIARRLIEELLKRGKERGVACATLEVRASNEAAIRLYEGFGFVRSAKRKGYYPDNKEDAVIMWKHEV